jgi:Tfp pilus assembly protein PilN
VIRTNLATRPFYNERAVHLAILLLALIVVIASVFNVTRVIQLSRSDTRLGTQASRDEARAAELRAQAARLRASVDPRQIEVVSVEARKANDLIDRRTFSWTELFNRLETTLPDEVRITSVRPKVDSSGTTLTISVIARAVDDVSQFMDNLQKTGAFKSVGARIEEHMNEQGQLEAVFEAIYLPLANGRGEK